MSVSRLTVAMGCVGVGIEVEAEAKVDGHFAPFLPSVASPSLPLPFVCLVSAFRSLSLFVWLSGAVFVRLFWEFSFLGWLQRGRAPHAL